MTGFRLRSLVLKSSWLREGEESYGHIIQYSLDELSPKVNLWHKTGGWSNVRVWVKRRHLPTIGLSLLYPRERTSAIAHAVSLCANKRHRNASDSIAVCRFPILRSLHQLLEGSSAFRAAHVLRRGLEAAVRCRYRRAASCPHATAVISREISPAAWAGVCASATAGASSRGCSARDSLSHCASRIRSASRPVCEVEPWQIRIVFAGTGRRRASRRGWIRPSLSIHIQLPSNVGHIGCVETTGLSLPRSVNCPMTIFAVFGLTQSRTELAA